MRRTVRRLTALLVLTLLVTGNALAQHGRTAGPNTTDSSLGAAAGLLAAPHDAGYGLLPTWSSALPLGCTPLEPANRYAGNGTGVKLVAGHVAHGSVPPQHEGAAHALALRLRAASFSSFSTSLPPPSIA